MTTPRQLEIWQVNFDPQVGAEIEKKRPAVVISVDAIGILPVKIVVPITEWQEQYDSCCWYIPITPDQDNGLSKKSVVDVLQTKSVSIKRFVEKRGELPVSKLHEIQMALAICIGG